MECWSGVQNKKAVGSPYEWLTFQKVDTLKKTFPNVPFLLLTATAIPVSYTIIGLQHKRGIILYSDMQGIIEK